MFRIPARVFFLLPFFVPFGSGLGFMDWSSNVQQPYAAPVDAPTAVPPAPELSEPAVAPVAATPLVWPVGGGISSRFGPSHRLGIDIGLSRTPDAPIRAAAGGTVVFAGGSRCCGYGLHVIIDHGAGMATRYGHLSRVDVSEGQVLGQAELIGVGGNTGASTAPHLHFEVRQDNVPVDPTPLLPPTCPNVPGVPYREAAVLDAPCPAPVAPEANAAASP